MPRWRKSASGSQIDSTHLPSQRETRPVARLRSKTLCLFGATLLGLMTAFFGVTHPHLLSDFRRLEEKLAQERLQRGLAAIHNQLDTIDTTAHDWAAWDDTYQFIVDADRKYAEANFPTV